MMSVRRAVPVPAPVGLAVAVVACLALAAVGDVRADAAADPQFNVTVAAPWGCKQNDCKLRLTVIPLKDNLFHFALEAEAEKYVAMAIATSGMMGNDSVIECVKSNKTDKPVDLFHSTNMGPPVMGRMNKRDENQDAMKVMNLTDSYKDGRIMCSFVLKQSPGFPNQRLDLKNNRYFLQIVAGDKVDENNLAKHTQWAVTLRAVSLVRDEGKLRTIDNVPKSSASSLTVSGLVLTMLLIVKAWL